MFVRTKPSGKYQYLQIVESRWEDGRPRQYVIATLGRLDRLKASGQVDAITRSLAKFSEKVKVIEDYKGGKVSDLSVKKVGPDLIVRRLWRELGINEVLNKLLSGREYEFEVERAIYFTVLSRLFFPGSDRTALRISRDYKIEGIDGLDLHHFNRAMAWLGDSKDEVEEGLFLRNIDLFSGLNLVFFYMTSIYFEGNGGESLGRYGYSKDKRSDEKQMVVGAVMDATGRPISCQMWSGNMADIKTLIPVIERLKDRFGVGDIVIVADKGTVSKGAVKELKSLGIGYILGVKMRKDKKVSTDVLSRAGKYKEVKNNLKVKEVQTEGGRYIVCAGTNKELSAEDVALRYKELWEVERIFKEVKSVLETRPIYHKYDSAIKGHVFCNFLALVVMKELIRRLDFKEEWDEIRQDLDSLYEVEVMNIE